MKSEPKKKYFLMIFPTLFLGLQIQTVLKLGTHWKASVCVTARFTPLAHGARASDDVSTLFACSATLQFGNCFRGGDNLTHARCESSDDNEDIVEMHL